MKKKWIILSITILAVSILVSAEDWGEIRYVHSRTNVRANRSTESAVVQKLEAGRKVKVDFLKDGWYAVFTPDKVSRFESDALGYVYAALLKIDPPIGSAPKLRFRTVSWEDYNYGNYGRGMAHKVVAIIHKSILPTEEQLRTLAKDVWKNGNEEWKEFIVWIYLPDMNTDDSAYVTAKFGPSGLKSFITYPSATYGTKWYKFVRGY